MKTSSKSKLYIIGNGFDLHHGLDTWYSSFGLFLKANHEEIYDLLLKYFGLVNLDKTDPETLYDPIWADFEHALSSLDLDDLFEDHSDFVGAPVADDPKEYHAFQQVLEDVVNKLTEQLRDAFRNFIENVNYPDLDIVNSKLLSLDKRSVFLNFNYTVSLERYYNISKEQILYIHGNAKETTSELILGHGVNPKQFREEEPKPPQGLSSTELSEWYDQQSSDFNPSFESGKAEAVGYFEKSFKPTAEILETNKLFFPSLSEHEEIYIFGHSLSDVDRPYIEEVIKSSSKDSKWFVSYYKPEERQNRVDRLIEFGLTQEQLTMVTLNELLLPDRQGKLDL